MPVNKTFAGSLSDATAKVDLTASYAKVGNTANIRELDAMTMLVREHANAENAVVKFFVLPDGAEPAASTAMYQVVGTNGAETELVVVQNTSEAFPLTGLSGRWFLLEGKGASSTTADLSAFMFAEEVLGKGKSAVWVNKLPILATSTQLTTSYADIGLFADISGLSNLTLYLQSTVGGTDPADVKVFIDKAYTDRTGTSGASTGLHPIVTAAAGAAIEYRVLTNERAAHPLGNVCGTWLMIQAKSTGVGTAATINAFLTGIAQGV
jgi:hypothetical protein